MNFLIYIHDTVTCSFSALRVIANYAETRTGTDSFSHHSDSPNIVNKYTSGPALSRNVLCPPIDRF